MTLWFVIHRPEEAADGAPPGPEAAATMRGAVRDAMWEIADTHWAMGEDAFLVATDLSPDQAARSTMRHLPLA